MMRVTDYDWEMLTIDNAYRYDMFAERNPFARECEM